ncbi:MAG: hypothetical protein U0V72_07195 [Cytophagales bacterium]
MKIALLTYTHPDFFPPVYEFYTVLKEEGHEPFIVSVQSYVEDSPASSYKMYTVANTFSNSFWGRMNYRKALENTTHKCFETEKPNLVISFCEVSFLLAHKLVKTYAIPHFHNSLEVYAYKISDFKRSFLSTYRRYVYLKNVNKAQFVSCPSYERAGLLTSAGNFSTAVHTILNCQAINSDDLEFVRQKSKNKPQNTVFIHTGGVNHTRSVLELVQGFHQANMPQTELWITNVKDNDYGLQIKKFIETQQLTHIKILGTVSREELIALQKQAHIGICFMKPHKGLGSQLLAPNKIGEYLKYGMNIVTVDMPYMDLFSKGFVKVNNIENIHEVSEKLQEALRLFQNQDSEEIIDILAWYNMKYQMRKILKQLNDNTLVKLS